jgi:hypothetical protein
MTYIIQDRDGYAIHGVGDTPDAAWRMVCDGVGQFHDRDGNDISPNIARETQFLTYPASPDLVARVRDCGGAIAWAIRDGKAVLA